MRVIHRTDDIPYKIYYYPMSFGDVLTWCERNCTGYFQLGFSYVVFDSDEDAILFALSVPA